MGTPTIDQFNTDQLRKIADKRDARTALAIEISNAETAARGGKYASLRDGKSIMTRFAEMHPEAAAEFAKLCEEYN